MTGTGKKTFQIIVKEDFSNYCEYLLQLWFLHFSSNFKHTVVKVIFRGSYFFPHKGTVLLQTRHIHEIRKGQRLSCSPEASWHDPTTFTPQSTQARPSPGGATTDRRCIFWVRFWVFFFWGFVFLIVFSSPNYLK